MQATLQNPVQIVRMDDSEDQGFFWIELGHEEGNLGLSGGEGNDEFFSIGKGDSWEQKFSQARRMKISGASDVFESREKLLR